MYSHFVVIFFLQFSTLYVIIRNKYIPLTIVAYEYQVILVKLST